MADTTAHPYTAANDELIRLRTSLADAQAEIDRLRSKLPPGAVRFRGPWFYCEDDQGAASFHTHIDPAQWAYAAPVMWVDDPAWTNAHGGKDTRPGPIGGQ